MPVFTFSSPEDVAYMKERDAEKHRLFYQPRRWLVHGRDSTTINLYGEPGAPVSGSDGVTSAPATRTLTSAGSDFVASGVKATDVLEVQDIRCDVSDVNDQGRFGIVSVNPTWVTIDQDWPLGNGTDLNFIVHILKENYTEFNQLVPFLVKLNPTEKELDGWGITEKRDAMVELSIKLCEDVGLVPKIGDRFTYPYEPREIQYELKNLFEADQLSDSGVPMHYIGFATRTTNRLP
jgi:hypothetical protein